MDSREHQRNQQLRQQPGDRLLSLLAQGREHRRNQQLRQQPGDRLLSLLAVKQQQPAALANSNQQQPATPAAPASSIEIWRTLLF
uniref:Uncharacterized protein n=1 Tax=Solanum tuberosum TaxID=4113 RepID=M1DCW9_SOLTU